MIHGWFDVVFAAILIGSAIYGIGRGFAREFHVALGQLFSIAIAAVAIRIAWIASRQLSAIALNQDTSTWPKWLAQLLAAWQHAPGVGAWIVFGICYLVFSSVLFRVLGGVAELVIRVVPGPLGRSRLLGGALGAIAGVVRVVLLGAAVFLALQYFSIPWLAAQARQSTVYQALVQRVYKPWIQPLAERVFPVFGKDALQSLSQNINLFVLPSGSPGSADGVLLVPEPIAALARQLTQGVNGPEQKAHILYEWEIHHVAYDWHKFDDYVYRHKWDQQSPLQTIRTGKGVCADYALLYANLAHASGLTVEVDEGIGGTSGNYGSHAWNEVWLPAQRRWITVDTTWGAVQDRWFGVPPAEFARTHILQTAIVVRA